MKKNIEEQIRYVIESIPFYSKYADTDITDLPIVNKLLIRDNYEMFVSNAIEQEKRKNILDILNDKNISCKESYNELCKLDDIIFEETTGTSGIPFRVIKSVRERANMGLAMWRCRKKIDHKVNATNLYLFNHTGLGKYNPQVYNYNEEHICKVYDDVIQKNSRWLHTSIVPLKEHINILKKYPEYFDFKNLKYIELTGNFLYEDEKKEVEDFFNAKVISYYGCIETWGIAYPCKNGSLHICEDNVYLELVDDNGKVIVEPNEVGHVLVTTLHTKAMPLVRYNTGDFGAYKQDENCLLADRTVIELQEGRESNYIKGLKQRRLGSKQFGNILSRIRKERPLVELTYIQFVQVELTKFKIYINAFEGYKELVNDIKQLTCERLRLENTFQFEVEVLDAIELDQKKYEKPNLFICKC